MALETITAQVRKPRCPEEDRMKRLLLPMLATAAAPFDGEDYLFEVKWDGVRALAASEAAGRWRLWGRTGADYTARYAELAVLARLPAGTVVDGELVVLRDGRADFSALLRRHQRQRPELLRAAGCPGQPAVCYVLFDLLFHKGQSLLAVALAERRARLRELMDRIHEPRLVYSEGVPACGRSFFAQVVAQGHEGVIAKHQASRYRPGKRSSAWRKIKPVDTLPCVVVGYQPGREGVQRLLLATVHAGILRYVGRLRTGGAGPDLARRLAARRRACPVVSCPSPACWVEPELYCRVAFQGWTIHGRLRYPVFAGWLESSP
jgi:DNA ligase D-like protein (predicted ligase)